MVFEVFLNKSVGETASKIISIESTARNMTALNATTMDAMKSQRKSVAATILLFSFLLVGVLGNFLALVILSRKKNPNTKSYTLMLRSLTCFNLVGLLGVATQLIIKRSLSAHSLDDYTQWFCGGWVIFRYFGISSGCIAVIMSIDRYISMNHPFIYHERITFNLIRNAIIFLSIVAAIVTFLPLVGFGLYFDKQSNECLRYRDAETLADKMYAVLFLVFGTTICVTIVTCNAFVMRAIFFKFRGSSLSLSSNIGMASTVEVKFSKLMVFLSLSFVICWMPQMISIVLALKPNPLPREHWFFNLSDFLIALHFISDPFVFVLSRKKIPCMFNFQTCRGSGKRRTPNKRNSLRTKDRIDTDTDLEL